MTNKTHTQHKNCSFSQFFWPVFFPIWTDPNLGRMREKSPEKLRIRTLFTQWYRGHCQTSMIELFCENNQRLKTAHQFCKKTLSLMFEADLKMPLDKKSLTSHHILTLNIKTTHRKLQKNCRWNFIYGKFNFIFFPPENIFNVKWLTAEGTIAQSWNFIFFLKATIFRDMIKKELIFALLLMYSVFRCQKHKSK